MLVRTYTAGHHHDLWLLDLTTNHHTLPFFLFCQQYIALEDLETQKHGLVYLIESRNANILKVDNKLSKMNQRAAKGAIPVRMTCFHMVHPPALMGILWPLVKRFLSKRLLKRMKIHYASSDDDILIQLAEFEITKETVPVESGGALPFDPKGWIEARRDQEK